jgi:hypothetical protein
MVFCLQNIYNLVFRLEYPGHIKYSLPTKSPWASCRRYSPRGMWWDNLATIAALCLAAAATDSLWGVTESVPSNITPSKFNVLDG